MTGKAALFSLLAFGIGAASAARADTFDFAYSGAGISAMGTLTATLQSPGKYLITGISGERNGVTISSLLAPNGYNGIAGGNDNLLYFPSNPGYLDRYGFAYTAGGIDYNPIYYTNNNYYEGTPNGVGGGTYTVIAFNAHGEPAPVPGGGLLSFLALGLAGLAWRGKAITAQRRSYLAPSNPPAPG